MDNQQIWKEEYNIGVGIIDQEHQKLFKIINGLLALKIDDRKSLKACREGIEYLKEHAINHFADEEDYMRSIRYEGLETHKRIHKGFREETLPALEQELLVTEYAPDAIEHFIGVCAGWLIGHTLTEDQAIVSGKISKWTNLLPGDQLTEMKKVITKLMHTMFQMESQVISETYGGERFGKGVYYRLVYSTDQGNKQTEIILVFEEKLLINTVGKIMGLQGEKLDVLLVNAARYTAKQFVWHVMQQFPALKLSDLKEENLLTYDQFQTVLEEKKLQISLLFNTDEGYFAYCVIAPHLLQGRIGTPIRTMNAVSEVERYLIRQREEEEKPKILVVDDSVTIRQGMRNLLGNEYEITTVRSGVAAIRAITLDRPDLVLLDYEMPVCDGHHVLEMLRSEEEFAGISVIFLTSKGDPESVQKVMELKPDGYMLKYLKPLEIKRRIDMFFQKKKAAMPKQTAENRRRF